MEASTTTKLATRAEALLVETGDKRDGRGRQLRLVERRAGFVRSYQASGLTMAAFARREGLKYSTFAGWVLRHVARGAGRAASVRFAEVRLPGASASTPGLEVRFVDGTVARGSNVAELAALVRALRNPFDECKAPRQSRS